MAQDLRRSNISLGDSWVVEHDDENNLGDTEEQGSSRQSNVPVNDLTTATHYRDTSRRKSSRTSSRQSAEPEFLMPSIHEDNMAGSRVRGNARTSNRSDRQETPRRRLPRSATGYSSGLQQVQRSSSPATDQSSSVDHHGTAESIFNNTVKIVRPMLGYGSEVTGGALRAIKTPLSYALALYLVFGMLTLLRNLATNTVYGALSPLCRIPGSSLLELPFCRSPLSDKYGSGQQPPVQFDQLMTAQSKFEEVLEESAGGVSLPYDMKRGEASIRDLRTVVKHSHLNSRNELVLEFDGFIDTARMASLDLQKFNSHVGRAVDSVLSTNRWTSRVLEEIAVQDASRGAVQAFLSDKLLAPFQPVKFTEDALLEQYLQHTNIVEEQINRLIEEAQAVLGVLQNLEDRLEVIHEVVSRDDARAQASKEQILSQLWTMLGGNRSKLSRYNRDLSLLQQVGEYRKSAWAHVSGTILKLQSMSADIEGLRERLGDAEILKDRANIPLSVHIENIQLGVERLEAGRQHAKTVQDEQLKKVLDRGKMTKG
ncbi:MAG: hypothetical protein M1835_003609 [Candelina submexicana]|nr:MAG: hypothetical protein M1835_003609 [Candelina submexicana]